MSTYASNLNSYESSAALHPDVSIFSGISDMIKSVDSFFSSFSTTIMEYISYLIIAAFILPAFSLALTYISIREIANLLGSEITFNMFDLI